ncbi:class V chitinase CHIT5a-like [Castanea sativa]|uniref:class V chitinase CHIT5a-like n=1 Tax=Castanea sativa TaxID=21020 RepID=UPI003F64DF28
MVSNKKTCAIFINLSIKVARKFSFNGLDLDWEFPTNKVDMSNLALLFKEWQKALVNEAKLSGKPRFLLSSADPSINGIQAPAVGVGPRNGTMAYFEILEFNSKNSATNVYDTQFGSYYSYSGDSWIRYNDVDSVSLKIRFAHYQGLGGYFYGLWAWTRIALSHEKLQVHGGDDSDDSQ